MQFTKSGETYIIRLERGESIISSITSFCKEESITAAMFNAIGALSSATLAFYKLDKKGYELKKLTSDHEISSLTGNISLVDNQVFAHIHCVLSNNKFECVGGHLKEGTVGATCEIQLVKFDKRIERKMDESIGLNLLDCNI